MTRERLFNIVLIAALFIAIIAFVGACNVANKRKPKTKVVTEYDTVFVDRVDTFFVEVPTEKTRFVTKTIHDTLMTTDSVFVEVEMPIETAMYHDTIATDSAQVVYTAWVSGYDVNLDSLGFIVHNRFHQVNTTTTITKKRGGRWGFGVTAGYFAGWDFVRNNFTNGLGLSVGITYKITR